MKTVIVELTSLRLLRAVRAKETPPEVCLRLCATVAMQ
jgi:hypothetical protein